MRLLVAVSCLLLACPGPGQQDAGTGGGGGRAGGSTAGGNTAGGNAGGVATAGGAPLSCTPVDAGPPPDAGAPPDAGPRTAPPYDGGYSTFCSEYAAAYCDWQLACGLGAPGTRADCVALYTRYYCNILQDEIARGGLLFDRAAAGLCLDSIAPAAGCLDRGCPPYLIPDAGRGGSCLTASACPLDAVCAGPLCSRSCVDAGAIGEPCRYGTCATGWCDRAADLCRPPQGPGGGCSQPVFNNPQCDATTYCDLDAGRCTRFPGPGQPCPFNACADGYACRQGLCRPYLDAGEPCTDPGACGPTQFCQTTCNVRRPADAGCQLNSQCEPGLLCFASRCTVPKTEGQGCRGFECASGLLCDDVTRTCERNRSMRYGEACTGDARFCASGLACTGARINPNGGVGCFGVCLYEALGDACTSHTRCPVAAFCGDAGVCLAGDAGTPCATNDQCPRDLYCTAARVCAARHGLQQPCERTGSCASPYECRGSTADGGARCLGQPGLGEPCSSPLDCLFPLTCSSGLCATGGHLGEACIYGFACIDNACDYDAGRCVPLRDAGEPCGDTIDCTTGWCDRGVCQNRCP